MMGSFSRLRYVIAANVNSLLEKAEDPEKLLKALIRDMEDASEDARIASADLLGEQTHLHRLQERYDREIAEWTARAEKAVETNRDDLARAALKARAELEQASAAAADEAKNLDARITQLEFDMAQLKTKLAEAKSKLKDISKRPVSNAKGRQVYPEQDLSPAERKVRRAMGRFERLQSQVERLEARVRSYEVGGESTNVWANEETPASPEIEDELNRLKNRLAPAAEKAPVKAEPEQEA